MWDELPAATVFWNVGFQPVHWRPSAAKQCCNFRHPGVSDESHNIVDGFLNYIESHCQYLQIVGMWAGISSVWLYTPYAKSYAFFLQTQKLKWYPHPVCTISVGAQHVCKWSFPVQNVLTFCINLFCTGGLNAVTVRPTPWNSYEIKTTC